MSSAIYMASMFEGAAAFNQDLSSRNVSQVNDFRDMFRGDSAFNQDFSNWDIGNAGKFEGIFASATSFQGLGR